MATTPTTSEGAGRTPLGPPPTPAPPGIFTSPTVIGYVELDEELQVDARRRHREANAAIPPWDSLATLKILIPTEAADLIVMASPAVAAILRRLEARVIQLWRARQR